MSEDKPERFRSKKEIAELERAYEEFRLKEAAKALEFEILKNELLYGTTRTDCCEAFTDMSENVCCKCRKEIK